jgi:solute carrier family 13 (sodium-dependent dicarboxylate transporter), member 2/3/5
VLVLGLIGGVAALLSPLPEGLSEEARRAAVIGAIMALLWVTEALPLAVTAMIPLAAFPLARVAEMENVSRAYAHPIVFLFLGGFVLAAAMQHWQLDRRLSLIGLRVAGPRPELQILSMMAATAFLSMWISNTATAMVMMPIGLAMLGTDGRANGTLSAAALKAPANEVGAAEAGKFGTAMMLGIAFAATIGGMGSLIGTPPNALFAAFVEKTYDVSIGFGQWMLLGIPIVILLLPITWILLTRVVFHLPPRTTIAVSEREKPPAMSTGQRILAMVLALTAFAWISRPYLAAWLGLPGLSDAGIAITAALTLFVLPADKSLSRPLLTWDEVKSIRWDVLILFGGGLALADAIRATGLADWIGGGAAQLSNVPVVTLILIMMVLIVYLGELASNTAMAAVFLPVAAAAAAGLGAEPLSILLPVALAASLGFMLPVATPPNAIVYGSGAVSAQDMLRAGAILDVISIVLVFILATTLGPIVFGLNGAANP